MVVSYEQEFGDRCS